MSATDSTWAGLEMRHLLALAAVVDTGSFSAAAEQLGYTQSAVSQQIGTLERLVGAPLFQRPGGARSCPASCEPSERSGRASRSCYGNRGSPPI
jgi:molybdenum-dependent DNA-binding transcriptional regulator ModE